MHKTSETDTCLTGLYCELCKPINVDENLQDFEQDNKTHAHLITEGKNYPANFYLILFVTQKHKLFINRVIPVTSVEISFVRK